MDKHNKLIMISVLLGTFVYVTSVIIMLGMMAVRLVELTEDIQDTTIATKQLYDEIYETLENIKLICPEELIEKDGDPIEHNTIEDLPVMSANYEYDYVRATCYTDETGSGLGICYDGTPTYYGCVAGSKEQLGKTAMLFDEQLNYLGTFEFHDVGDPAYVNSKRIDIWQPNITEVDNWIEEVGDYVYIIYI